MSYHIVIMNIRVICSISSKNDVKSFSMEFHEDTPLFSSDAVMILIAFILCVECAKIPEYRCENCDKVYKQESRYNAHIAACIGSDTIGASGGSGSGGAKMDVVIPSAADFSELLRQNREMMEIMRKQQETIQLLVSKMNIESSR
jgi:hypothetical protein